MYAKVLKAQMDSAKTGYVPAEAVTVVPKNIKPPVSTRKGRSKRPLEEAATTQETKRVKVDDSEAAVDAEANGSPAAEKVQAFKQPVLVTGAKLKDYQLEGVAWMMGLYKNGISGILGK